jgi:K+-sensing histidine kinase KdpD
MRAYLADLAHKSASIGVAARTAPRFSTRPIVLLYGVALIAVAVALAARLILTPIVGDESPYLFFVPAVLVAAGVAGLGPGLLATAVSTVFAIFVVQHPHDMTSVDLVNAAAFAFLGLAIAWGGEQLQQTRVRAVLSTRDALAREAHLQSILDTVPEAMIVIDERAITSGWNRHWSVTKALPRARRLPPGTKVIQLHRWPSAP